VEIWPSHNALSWSLMAFNGVKRSGRRGGCTVDVVEVKDGLDEGEAEDSKERTHVHLETKTKVVVNLVLLSPIP
jgi:hypothetical protein